MSTRRLAPLCVLAVAAAATLTAPAGAAPAPTPGPRVSNLIAPTAVVGRQGHVRFLVGIRNATTARVIVRTLNASGKVVRTTKTPAAHAPGRVWLLVQATNVVGQQLKAGRYRIEVYAVDADRRRSNVITRRFTLTLRAPRAVVQAYTVPSWPSLIGGVATGPGGQIVAAVPPTSTLGTAGVQRGDLIRTINDVPVDTRGAWFAVLRGLAANSPVTLGVDRAGVRQTLQFTPPPDWSTPVRYDTLLTESVAAAPSVRAFRYAQARERIDNAQAQTAQTLFNAWPATDKTSAPGEMISGALSFAEKQYVTAVGAYNRALVADPTVAAAQFAIGLARSDNGQNDRAITAFQAARTLDPSDALAATFHAYSLLVADQFQPALEAADAAIALDPRYEEGHLARGLALIGLARVPEGVVSLKRGLVLSSNADRAQQLITSSLEPNTP